MKGLSVLLTISLLVFTGLLSNVLQNKGVLPSQIAAKQDWERKTAKAAKAERVVRADQTFRL